ncbi:hypothetical protein R8Z50_22990 [Longispora sp. K20-0274]|uniref:hypothetical protein n=1 Tax=Longispora sp. K20-0274 TaxID=3088255 RepID=UPI00399B3475
MNSAEQGNHLTVEPAVRPGLREVREYHLSRLANALRRPGMWGGEITLGLFLDAVAFIDGRPEEWSRDQDELRTSGAFTSIGVRGGFAAVLPGHDCEGATASVYGDIAYKRGWLSAERVLPDGLFRRLRSGAEWLIRDWSLDEVLAVFGEPSVWFGGANPRFPKTLAYAGADRADGLVCLHFASTYDWQADPPAPDTPPILLAARHGVGPFPERFTFTPTGSAVRARTEEDDD